MPLPSPPFHEPEAIKHPVADGKEPSIGEILPVILGPNITGGFGQLNETSCGGVFYKGGTYAENIKIGQSWTNSTVMFDATRVSSIYGASTTVQPYSLVFNYIIKY